MKRSGLLVQTGIIGAIGALVLGFAGAIAGCGGGGAKGGSGGATGSGGTAASGGNTGSGGTGGDGATAGGSVTTLDGSKSLGSLSATEVATLCSDTYSYYQQNISQATLCKETGLAYGISSSAPTDSQLRQNCTSQQAACLTAGFAVPSCSNIPVACAATVAQYSTCIADQVAAFNSGVAALATCATVTLADLQTVWAFVAADPPASCASLTNTCAGFDVPTPHPGTNSPTGTGGTGATAGTGGSNGSGGTGATTGTGGSAGSRGTGGSAGTPGSGGLGGVAGNAARGGAGGSAAGSSGRGGAAGATATGGSTGASTLPGDVAKAAGTPFVAAHAMTRTLFAAYTGPLFKALRVSDKQEKDIGFVASTGLVDLTTLNTFCSGTSCKVTTLYDQSGNSNDMWRADDPSTNQPGTVKPCDLMDIQYWQMSDGTKVPIAVESGAMWKSTAQCLRNRDKTKNMPTGSKPETEYGIFHAQYLNNNCCFNYGNTGNAVHYSGPGTLSALNFSTITFWSQGTGSGPWPMVDFETGVYAGNTAKCGSGVPSSVTCTSTGQNPNPSVTFPIVTTLFKHNGVNHWALKTGNAKAGALSVNIDLAALPNGYSPLKQEGGLGLGEGGAGDSNGTGGFSEGGVIAGETTDATDDAFQKSIVSVYGK
jgi:hypothetical protein